LELFRSFFHLNRFVRNGQIGIQAFCNIKSITEYAHDFKKEVYHYPVAEKTESSLVALLQLIYSNNTLKKVAAFRKALPIIRAMFSKSAAAKFGKSSSGQCATAQLEK